MNASDHGDEFSSNAIHARSKDHGVARHSIEQGQPMRNG
jgi:hypothetical protein